MIRLSLAFCIILSFRAVGQDASVERATYGVQIGWGIWVYQEARISHATALRSEIGIHTRIRGGNLYEKPKFVMSPVLTLEPRWYYNLANRLSKGKRIDGNSGNYISIKTSWHPDLFKNSTVDGMNDLTDISIVPTWGIRRHIGRLVTYEAGVGVGCRLVFAEYAGMRVNELDGVIHVNLRVGLGFD